MKFNPVCVVQARIGGSRLPRKVLEPIAGVPMLGRVMDRLQRSRTLKKIVVAIPDTPENDELETYIRSQGWYCYRGSEDDVLSRYAGAARKFKADPVVRVTADCPLIDWGIVDGCVRLYEQGALWQPNFPAVYDYVSNNLEKTFPHGTDVEVFSAEALAKANEMATDPFDREHVASWITDRQDRPYRLGNLRYPIEGLHPFEAAMLVASRLTVDYMEDLDVVKAIYEAFPSQDYITISDVMGYFHDYPEIMELNQQRAIDHLQHLSGRFEPISSEQRQALSQDKAKALIIP